jgi:predicted transglutaminase-like cysteine proteinase
MANGLKIKLFGVALCMSLLLFSAQANAEMFGKQEIKSTNISQFKKWNSVIARQKMAERNNDEEISLWKNDLKPFKKLLTTRQKIEAVNNYINAKIEYKFDSEVWGKSDYWASVAETFGKGYGDCDDYAIAKYFTLKELGFSEDDMRIVVLKDHSIEQIHAVLSVKINGTHYILDNQSPYLRVDSQITFYDPIYSINQRGWWRHV